MPATAVSVPVPQIETPPQIRALQLAKLAEVCARLDLDPTPNELPQDPEPESPEVVLRRHLSHLRIRGSILDLAFVPPRNLAQFVAIDGVPLEVVELDRYAPLQGCILCGGPKGESYTICAGCWTTQTRLYEREMLKLHPDVTEKQLAGFKALPHAQYVRAIRRAPRLERTRLGYLQPGLEAIRRRKREAVQAAHHAARIDALRAAIAEEGISRRERAARSRLLRAAQAATAWSAREWYRQAARLSLDDAWLAELAAAGLDEGIPQDDDDEYPVEWLAGDWMIAPDRVAFTGDSQDPLIANSNTAAGTDEHLDALQRNVLFDTYRSARARSWFQEGLEEYIAWLGAKMDTLGGVPARLRARVPDEWDGEECDRWDRWIDSILGGKPAAAPSAVEPIDAALCARWGARYTGAAADVCVPVQMPGLDSDFPSGRIRWPHFVRDEIEAEYHVWGHWVVLAEDDGATLVWCGDTPGERCRRIRPDKLAEIQRRRLKRWAENGPEPRRGRVRRVLRPDGTWAAWSRDVAREWAEAIRADRRRRRFEALAEANSRVHATHFESARYKAI